MSIAKLHCPVLLGDTLAISPLVSLRLPSQQCVWQVCAVVALSIPDSLTTDCSVSMSLSVLKDGKRSRCLQFTFPICSKTSSNDEHLLVSLPSHLRYRFRLLHRLWNGAPGPFLTSRSSPSLPQNSRLMHVLRTKLAEKLYTLPALSVMMGEGAEIQRFGRRSLLSFGVDATLEEWETFTQYVRTMLGITVLHSPPYVETDVPRFQEEQLEMSFVDYSSFMRCLGHISHDDIVRHLVMTKRKKGRKTRNSDIAVRVIGDIVQDGRPSSHVNSTSSRTVQHPMTFLVGGTVTPLKDGAGGNEQRLILYRSSSEWDTRDHVFVEDLELKQQAESDLVEMMTDDMREKNRVLISGKKRQRQTERFLGFRFTQPGRLNKKRIHFDRESAREVLGELQVCVPTMIFIRSANAVDISEQCTKEKMRSLFHSSPTPS